MLVRLTTLFKRVRLLVLYLFHQLDASLEIHTEIHEDPIDTFLLVLFLFKNEHVMVEKLLQFLVGEVDAQLFKAVELHFCSYKAMQEAINILFSFDYFRFSPIPTAGSFSTRNKQCYERQFP